MKGPAKTPAVSSQAKLLLAFLGVSIALSARQIYLQTRPLLSPASTSTAKTSTPAEPRPDPAQLARPHLDWAAAESERAIEEALRPIRTFFRDSKKQTADYAADLLGFRSKMKLVWDTLPLTEKVHPTFVRTRFEEKIFKPADLEKIVEQTVFGYLQQVAGIEGEMLVRLRTDMADFPDSYPIVGLDRSVLKKSYEDALAVALEASGDDLTHTGSELLVSTVAGEVLTIVALRIGVSAGILGAGGATGTVTLGVGVVVGLIVDQVVSFVWDWYADPQGNLAATLNSKLDDMSLLIVSGPDGRGGIKAQLQKLAATRANLRREAILNVLKLQ